MAQVRPVSGNSRLVGIDIIRAVAIVAAMGSHCMNEAGLNSGTAGPGLQALRFVVQMSPPLFIGLFGSMLEIVYRKRFAEGHGLDATKQLLSRAAQCYLLYVASLIALLPPGDISAGYFLRCALLIGVTPYTDILKLYAIVLVLAPLLLAIRIKYGLKVLVAAAVVIQLCYPLIMAIPHPTGVGGGNYAELPAAFFYGGGEGVGGPSVLHGLSLVFFGMLVGNTAVQIMSADAVERRRGVRAATMLIAAAGAVTLALWNWNDPMATYAGMADMSLRNSNHPVYFAWGVVIMMSCVWLALIAYDQNGVKFGRGIAYMASTSLFTFSFGNIILYLAPKADGHLTLGPAYAIVLLALVLLQSYVFSRLMNDGKRDLAAKKNTMAATFFRLQSKLVGLIVRMVARPATAYFACLAGKDATAARSAA